ncbi:MAG: acyl-CoA-binding protein [Intrasporangium sp.]|uniref:acyl-CoA-binding protein n=1 Tax=Intrasporangium sp. TaxID=1925024 RepID=UPI003F8149CA
MASDFDSAVAAVGRLEKDPGNDVKLRLYALYKQATEGDVSGSRPGMMDFVGRAKYDAWAKLRGTPSEDARLEYARIVDGLLPP